MGSSLKRSRSLGTRTARSAPCSIATRRYSVMQQRHSRGLRHVLDLEAGPRRKFAISILQAQPLQF